jgi:hypothetical protein
VAKFEKLSDEEVQQLTKRAVRVDLTEYLAYLDTLKVGDWGAVTLEKDEVQRTVKRRLTIAAKERGLKLKYKTAEDGRIVFQVNKLE